MRRKNSSKNGRALELSGNNNEACWDSNPSSHASKAVVVVVVFVVVVALVVLLWFIMAPSVTFYCFGCGRIHGALHYNFMTFMMHGFLQDLHRVITVLYRVDVCVHTCGKKKYVPLQLHGALKIPAPTASVG